MTLLTTAPHHPTNHSRHRRAHLLPLAVSGLATLGAVTLIAYLLWPTFTPGASSSPALLPVSIGDTLFNVPTAAIRMKIQRHSGTQEGIDLSFAFPSLDAAETPGHVSDNSMPNGIPPIDRIFLSIVAHHDATAPELRLHSLYPRYLEQVATTGPDGLTMRAFRDETPYGGEDLFIATTPELNARCTRDATTPGMCLSERRVDGADLTFRFPRSWLAQWRMVANAMERLMASLHGPTQ
jgi:hypothetical protein